MPVDVLDYETPCGRLTAAIAAYLRGEIDNFALDDAVWTAAERDRALAPLAFVIWRSYDDVTRHRVSLDRRGWQLLRRCLALLLSADQPAAPWYDRRVDQPTLWPFRSWAALRRATPAVAAVPLPRYDPARHGRPVHSRAHGVLLWVVLAGGALAGAVWAAVTVAGWLR